MQTSSNPSPSHIRLWPALLLTGVLTLLHATLWFASNRPQPAIDTTARVAGLAFNAYRRWESPESIPSGAAHNSRSAHLADDLRALQPLTSHVRSYSVQEWPTLPQLVGATGMQLTLGVWLGADAQRNASEMRAAIAAAQAHPAVQAILVGNETQLQQRMPLAQLIRHLRTMRQSVIQPVSTAEPWHVWLDNPALADQVDFITVHLLPYWEGIPVTAAVDAVFERLRQVQTRFPHKRVIIGETGWPAAGPARGAARADAAAQAQFVRAFTARFAHETLWTPPDIQRSEAERLRNDAIARLPGYFLMEAIDQPWKISIEGEAGPNWGILDVYRQSKFAWSGPVPRDPQWRLRAMLACGLGALLTLLALLQLQHLNRRARWLFGLTMQALAAGAVLMLTQPLAHYFTALALVVWCALLLPSALMVLVIVTQLLEFADTYWSQNLKRVSTPLPFPAGHTPPRVSVHVACCNEAPDMVIATVNSLLALDWPTLDIIVIDNNTSDPMLWQPVERHVQRVNTWLNSPRAADTSHEADADLSDLLANAVGKTLTFRHIPQLAGFKAGALNVALCVTPPDTGWIAVVDADYVVNRDWLTAVGGYFEAPDVDIIQAPQRHRLMRPSLFDRMINAEYDSFFRIGMHHRHERNAIIQHGTMTLIRASTLRDLGGWNTACICEDTELGLRILQRGTRAVYVDHPMGTGLLPADGEAWMRQRYRWACGAMQILKTHLRVLLTGHQGAPAHRQLTRGQRYHFIAGWLPWWGDTLHLFMTVAALAWALGMLIAPDFVRAPSPLYMMPPVTLLAVRLLLGPLVYRRRMGGDASAWMGAAVAGMALSHRIARGVLAGLFKRENRFIVTRKSPTLPTPAIQTQNQPGGTTPSRTLQGSRLQRLMRNTQQEACLAGAFLLLIGALLLTPLPTGADAATHAAWLAMLALQALPYVACLTMNFLSMHPANDKATDVTALLP